MFCKVHYNMCDKDIHNNDILLSLAFYAISRILLSRLTFKTFFWIATKTSSIWKGRGSSNQLTPTSHFPHSPRGYLISDFAIRNDFRRPLKKMEVQRYSKSLSEFRNSGDSEIFGSRNALNFWVLSDNASFMFVGVTNECNLLPNYSNFRCKSHYKVKKKERLHRDPEQ